MNVLVMRKGSTAELSGGFDANLFPTLKTLPGIATDKQGQPIASGEWVVVVVLPRKDGTGEVNVSVRGLMPAGVTLRSEKKDSHGQPNVKLVEGRWFSPGQREVVVGKSIHDRFSGANVGDTMDFAKGQWKVVGIFDSGGTAYDSEIWGDVNQIAADFDRQGGYASAYLRATDPVAADALKHRVSDDQRLKLKAHSKPSITRSKPIRAAQSNLSARSWRSSWRSVPVCAMNTMYAAVAYRSREIATLRIIGFSRPSILTSFVIEALLLSLLGAVVGIVLILPFNGMSTGIGNQVTFSETVFSLHLTWGVAMAAVVFALIMGLLGGFAPAWRAARQDILTSLRA